MRKLIICGLGLGLAALAGCGTGSAARPGTGNTTTAAARPSPSATVTAAASCMSQTQAWASSTASRIKAFSELLGTASKMESKAISAVDNVNDDVAADAALTIMAASAKYMPLPPACNPAMHTDFGNAMSLYEQSATQAESGDYIQATADITAGTTDIDAVTDMLNNSGG